MPNLHLMLINLAIQRMIIIFRIYLMIKTARMTLANVSLKANQFVISWCRQCNGRPKWFLAHAHNVSITGNILKLNSYLELNAGITNFKGLSLKIKQLLLIWWKSNLVMVSIRLNKFLNCRFKCYHHRLFKFFMVAVRAK